MCTVSSMHAVLMNILTLMYRGFWWMTSDYIRIKGQFNKEQCMDCEHFTLRTQYLDRKCVIYKKKD